ncbi:hypothetical protein EHS25_006132 [Saitozyma podzolica]|uniref:Uncharacterized protein n=1 Tax=Saitozyma podzolica TaxID=1890683 RepID=A0A427XTP4_9TREE|nr:hypothetical protein EHS25_006132 [Saitozyma podzolica]
MSGLLGGVTNTLDQTTSGLLGGNQSGQGGQAAAGNAGNVAGQQQTGGQAGATQQTDAQGLPLGLDKTLNNVVGGTGLLK